MLLLGVAVLVAAGFVIWATTGSEPMPEALAALHSDDRLQVDAGPGKSFSQLDEPATGLIFYADGRVDPRACGQAARALGG